MIALHLHTRSTTFQRYKKKAKSVYRVIPNLHSDRFYNGKIALGAHIQCVWVGFVRRAAKRFVAHRLNLTAQTDVFLVPAEAGGALTVPAVDAAQARSVVVKVRKYAYGQFVMEKM